MRNELLNKGIRIDLEGLHEKLVDKRVVDSKQFLDNALYNFTTLEYSKYLINTLADEYKKKVENFHEAIDKSIKETGQAKIKFLDDTVNIMGSNVGISFLISKNIKDIIQYANNILDSLAQFVNSALLNSKYGIDSVDFGYLLKDRLEGATSIETKYVFEEIALDNEFIYLRKANNRIKHIKDLDINIGFSLFEDSIKQDIKSFTKNKDTFDQEAIVDKCNRIACFIEECIDKVCSSVLVDLDTVTNEYRFNIIKIDGQSSNIEKKAPQNIGMNDLDFLLAYLDIPFKNKCDIPKQLELMAVQYSNKKIQTFNYNYELVFLKNNDRYCGYAEAAEPISNDIIKYRKYNIYMDDGKKANEYIYGKKVMTFYPMASEGGIVILND